MSSNPIAAKLRTRMGPGINRPSPTQCRDVYKNFSQTLGRRKLMYNRCGRKAWKIPSAVEKFVVRRMLALRTRQICTTTTLQRELLESMHTELACSTIRKILTKRGYRWLPRAQKPKYSSEDKKQRLQFAEFVLNMTPEEYGRYLTMAMDGVVLAVPPEDAVARENFCRIGETHMWRKPSEAAKPELAGKDTYNKQVPTSRAVPMWGGIGVGGFGLVMFHQ